jgi:hypothetical protein
MSLKRRSAALAAAAALALILTGCAGGTTGGLLFTHRAGHHGPIVTRVNPSERDGHTLLYRRSR